jgi:hypothetical protein
MATDAMAFASRCGPRLYIMSQDAATDALLGALFLPAGTRLAGQYVRGSLLTFFVVHGKLLVRMRLGTGCCGATACFGVSAGGAWQAPCSTLLSLVNPRATLAQVLLWRRKVAAPTAAETAAPAAAEGAAAAGVSTAGAAAAPMAAAGVGGGDGSAHNDASSEAPGVQI